MYGGRSAASSSSSSREGVSETGRQQGVFTSPSHPQIYPTNINCVLYTFSAAPQQIVEITFNDFDLQIPATSKSEYDASFPFITRFPDEPHYVRVLSVNLSVCPSVYLSVAYGPLTRKETSVERPKLIQLDQN